MRNIHNRLDRLQARAPKAQQRTEIRPELQEFLDRYAEGKATGTVTEEDEETAVALKAELKRRRDAGLIGGGGGS